MALVRSKEIGKPLMVIGDPDNGTSNKYLGRDYECGDICVDLIGCKKCNNGLKQKIENYLPTLKTNSYVIFISCVMEYMDNAVIDKTIAELKRVSGGNLFIVTVDPYSLTSFIYYLRFLTGESGAKRRIFTEYPFKDITYVNNSNN
jgi:hypothetical protein